MSAIQIQKVYSIAGGSAESSSLGMVCPSVRDKIGDNLLSARLLTKVTELWQDLLNQEKEGKYQFAPNTLEVLLGFSQQLQDIYAFLEKEAQSIRPPIPNSEPPPIPPLLWKHQDSPSRERGTEVTGITSDRSLSCPRSRKIPLDYSYDTKAAANKFLQMFDHLDEPIALVDLRKVKSQHALWVKHLPLITPFYAVKCNPDLEIIRILDEEGANFDCATMDEIKVVLSCGIQPDRICFGHPCKPRSHVQYAREHGVNIMVFDSCDEIRKIADVFPSAQLLLRVRCEDADAQCPLSMKFGAGPDLWKQLLLEAQRWNMTLVGVSFHVGSGSKTPGTFEQALADARAVFNLAKECGLPPLTVLNIGGGYPGDDAVYFTELAQIINNTIHSLWTDEELKGMKLMAEPGRFFGMQSTDLLTKVLAKAKIPPDAEDAENVTKFRYYLNDGLYGSFNCLLYDHATVSPSLMRDVKVSTGPPCTLFGPTCDGFDTIESNVTYLPELDAGDWLLWRNMGAYTSASGSTFNGFPKPLSWYFESCPEENCLYVA